MASFPHHHPNRSVHRLCSGIFGFTHAFAVWQADPICARDRRDGKEDKLGTWRKPRECPVLFFVLLTRCDQLEDLVIECSRYPRVHRLMYIIHSSSPFDYHTQIVIWKDIGGRVISMKIIYSLLNSLKLPCRPEPWLNLAAPATASAEMTLLPAWNSWDMAS